MNIVVKTRMRKMPSTCKMCGYYVSSGNTYFMRPACAALASHVPHAKPLDGIHPAKERPKWCPLMEVPADG